MALLNLTVSGIRRAIRAIERNRREIERLQWRVVTRAANDIRRLFIRHLKTEINLATTRRTGRLLRVRVKVIRDRPNQTLRFLPDFPQTGYRTPPGRGRGGASKIGQYAFVVNSSKMFIQRAVRRTENDPELRAILRKHLNFIVNQINAGNQT